MTPPKRTPVSQGGDPIARERALDALTDHAANPKLSLAAVARRWRTTPATILKYGRDAYTHEGRRWVPKPFNRIPRRTAILTPTGPTEVEIRDSRDRAKVAEQIRAVKAYRERGDDRPMQALRGQSVTVDGVTYPLELDAATLDRLIEGGEVHYELYAR